MPNVMRQAREGLLASITCIHLVVASQSALLLAVLSCKCQHTGSYEQYDSYGVTTYVHRPFTHGRIALA
jgi:hypothetical protein